MAPSISWEQYFKSKKLHDEFMQLVNDGIIKPESNQPFLRKKYRPDNTCSTNRKEWLKLKSGWSKEESNFRLNGVSILNNIQLNSLIPKVVVV